MLNPPSLYRATVTSNTDPTGSRKIKVQCPQVAGLAELNWAEPLYFDDPIPDTGSIVWIFFNGGDVTKPVYLITGHPNQYGWQTPTLATGWSFQNSFQGLGGPYLRYRKTRDDEVYFYGNVVAGAGAGTTVFTLPATFFKFATSDPGHTGMSGFALRNSAGTVTPVSAAVDVATGKVLVALTQNGDEFHFNVRMPMRFLIT